MTDQEEKWAKQLVFLNIPNVMAVKTFYVSNTIKFFIDYKYEKQSIEIFKKEFPNKQIGEIRLKLSFCDENSFNIYKVKCNKVIDGKEIRR